jgi:hypothetical protein
MGWPILNIVHEFENLQKLKKKKGPEVSCFRDTQAAWNLEKSR